MRELKLYNFILIIIGITILLSGLGIGLYSLYMEGFIFKIISGVVGLIGLFIAFWGYILK